MANPSLRPIWPTRAIVVALAAVLTACAPPASLRSAGDRDPPATDDDLEQREREAQKAGGGEEDDAPRPALPEVRFTFGGCDRAYAGARECGTAKVPLSYAAPDGKKIDLFVARVGSAKPDAPQLYMLEGGPGGASAGLFPFAQAILERRPDMEIMLIDHRGVGRSTPIDCPASIAAETELRAQAAACVREIQAVRGDVLRDFTTSNAARDLSVAIAALKKPGQQVFVYGVSYGTHWGHRFLQISPTRVDGVILDSALPPDAPFLDDFNSNYDPALRRIADVCKGHPTCRARLGPDPFQRMAAIVGGAGKSACGQALGLDRNALVEVVAMMQLDLTTAQLVPAFLSRMERCSAADERALTTLLDAFFPPDPGAQPTAGEEEEDIFSDGLSRNITFGELWHNPPLPRATLEEAFLSHVIAIGMPVELADAQPVWPRYEWDEHAGKWAQTSMPVLTLNGDLDVQTPIEGARKFETKLVGADKYFVHIPWANHGVVIQSPTRDGDQCGLRIIVDFLANPHARPSTACTKETRPPDPDGDAATVKELFGGTSAWDGASTSSGLRPTSSRTRLRARSRLSGSGPRRPARASRYEAL